jgi:hypothetical protein
VEYSSAGCDAQDGQDGIFARPRDVIRSSREFKSLIWRRLDNILGDITKIFQVLIN